MALETTDFQNVTHYTEDLFLNELALNMKIWLDWAFLRIGAWYDIDAASSGAYGQSFSQLRPVVDRAYPTGAGTTKVWQGIRKDWCWESGVNYTDPDGIGHDPYGASGVIVDGSSVASSDYLVNYPLGRIIFDTAQDTGSAIYANYSFRDVQVYRADDAPWWFQLQNRTFRPDDIQWYNTPAGRGEFGIGAQHRVQLPAIVIEPVPRGRGRGYELGSSSLELKRDVLYHILAEDVYTRNKLADILQVQQDNTIWMFNSLDVTKSGDWPLDYQGEKLYNITYPDLVADITGHQWKKCYFADSIISEVESLHHNLHEGTVRITHEIVFGSP